MPAAKKHDVAPQQRTLLSFFSPQSKAKPASGYAPAQAQAKTPTRNPPRNAAAEALSPPRSELRDSSISAGSTSIASPMVAAKEQLLSSSSAALQTPAASSAGDFTDDIVGPTGPPSSPLKARRSRKRGRVAVESDDEDDEQLPDAESEYDNSASDADYKDGGDEMDLDDLEVIDEDLELDVSETEAPRNPKKRSPARSPKTAVKESTVNVKTPTNSLAKFSQSSSYVAASPGPRTQAQSLAHSTPKMQTPPSEERYGWLVDIRDADGNRPGDADYDPRTIYVPSSAWAKFTPFEKQYWEIKQKLWDTVVFFKKGKFYELYENDAEIAHTKFDLKLAGGGRANMQLAGIPEMSFDTWAATFIAHGYKVARVDQKESALAKEMRDATLGKKEEKIVKRELACILTAGTLTDEAMLVDDLSQFCMAIKQNGLRFAVAFVDTSTGAFQFSEFEDDEDLSYFETLMAQTRPRELVLERGNLSKVATRAIKNNTSVDTLWNIVKPGVEFWDADTTLQRLAVAQHFPAADLDDFSQYPEVLQKAKDSDLQMSAFGGLLWYLGQLKLDAQLVSLGNFTTYEAVQKGTTMILDGQTLQNLEIFANTFDQSTQGTLFRLLNRCITPFGKRKLRHWVSHPLQTVSEITVRQRAVELLINHDELRERLERELHNLADVERLLSRIHAGNLPARDFVRVVQGLEQMANLLHWLSQQDFKVSFFEDITRGRAQLKELVAPWMTAFDHRLAQSSNIITPQPGVETEFDRTKADIDEIERELETHLKQYRKDLGTLSVCYRDGGKEIYQIEVPIKNIGRVPDSWQQMGGTGKVKRFWSPEVRALVRKLQEARELHKVAAETAQFRLYAKFNQHYREWLDAAHVVATIDCIVSLALASASMTTHCLPEFVEGDRAMLEFKELRHPSMGDSAIPNDVSLGGEFPKMSLLTGANAAGKSTVLRMTGCAVVMAQLGCHVPAESARLTPVDRIMTRIGASDNIFAGKSTFHMELAETQRILSEATARSLIVVDELGRGGSSSDGFAIAESVLHHIATYIGCTGFFATHYGTLMDSFVLHPEVRAQQMAIVADTASREVTFLYKLIDGRSQGSFGMNVALMCGVSQHIVAAAELAAKEHEHTQRLMRKGFHKVPLGLQSDVVYSTRDTPSSMAVDIMAKVIQAMEREVPPL